MKPAYEPDAAFRRIEIKDAIHFKPIPRTFRDHARFRARRKKQNRRRGLDEKLKIIVSTAMEDLSLSGVVAVADQSDPNQHVLQQLQSWRKEFEQEHYTLAQRCVVGVAIREIEAWLLADRGACSNVFGQKWKGSAPEMLADPKSVLQTLIGQLRCNTNSPISEQDIRKALADLMDPEVVARQCPKGFAPFKNEVEQRLLPLFGG